MSKRFKRYIAKSKNRILSSSLFKRARKQRLRTWSEDMVPYKTPLPRKQFDEIFEQGRKAASRGWERIPPYSNSRNELPWLVGYDSYEKRPPTPV